MLKLHEIEIPIRKVRWPKFLSEPNSNLTNKRMSLIIVLKDICIISNFFRKILKWKKSLNSHLSISIKPAENSIEFAWSNHSWKAHTIIVGLFFSKIIINVNRTFIRKIWVKTYHASYRSLRSIIICQNFLVGHMVC